MPHFDILFLDMDGTVLKSDKTVSKRTQNALKAAQAAGVKLVVATGRTFKIAPPIVYELNFDYAIISNGASIYDLKTGERVYHKPFNPDSARVLYDLIKDDCDFIEYFEKNLASKISLEDVALSVGISPSGLIQHFNRYTGTTPIRYLNLMRVKRAEQLLCSSDGTLYDIAAECGFENPFYFSNVFKKEKGISPREYRKNFSI